MDTASRKVYSSIKGGLKKPIPQLRPNSPSWERYLAGKNAAGTAAFPGYLWAQRVPEREL
jgi:hypothetical protein